MKKTFLPLACALVLAACGGGSSNGSAGAKGPISQDRSAAFKSFMPTFVGMGKVVSGDDAYHADKFKEAAARFVDEARVPFEFFQSDEHGNGDALPAIWAKPDEFKAAQEQFLNAVDQLNSAAQSGNLDSIKAAYGNVGASCQACHDSFRVPQ